MRQHGSQKTSVAPCCCVCTRTYRAQPCMQQRTLLPCPTSSIDLNTCVMFQDCGAYHHLCSVSGQLGESWLLVRNDDSATFAPISEAGPCSGFPHVSNAIHIASKADNVAFIARSNLTSCRSLSARRLHDSVATHCTWALQPCRTGAGSSGGLPGCCHSLITGICVQHDFQLTNKKPHVVTP